MLRVFVAFLVFTVTACGSKEPDSRRVWKDLYDTQNAMRGRDRGDVEKKSREIDPEKEPGTPEAELPWLPIDDSESRLDVLHYDLRFRFVPESFWHKTFTATAIVSLQSLTTTQKIELDAKGLEISSVKDAVSQTPYRFQKLESVLVIDLGEALPAKTPKSLAIDYAFSNTFQEGVTFEARDGESSRNFLYSQSEPELSKYWFPSHSRPNDRATFETQIEVPVPMVAISNGQLVSRKKTRQETEVFHFKMRDPMTSYLFVIHAGLYEVAPAQNWREIPVEFFGYKDELQELRYTLRKTHDMLDFFSDLIGMPYPYEKYAQIVVPKYQWGGMEHTTATTLTDRTVHSEKEEEQFPSHGLVSHELAHQWFGDWVTCKDWSHLWLNEGFATYFSALYDERLFGQDFFLEGLAELADWNAVEDRETPRPIVFKQYRHGLEDFFDSKAYGKGARVLHTLRYTIGDRAFFSGIKKYLEDHRLGLVTTDDLEVALEATSGQDLDWFFEQWIYRPSQPAFEVSWTYEQANREVVLRVKQTQDLSRPGGVFGTVALFKGPIPVEIDNREYRVELEAKVEQTIRIKLASPREAEKAEPMSVVFNSRSVWLANVVDTSAAHLQTSRLEQTYRASKIASSRVWALGSLARLNHSPRFFAECAVSDSSAWVRRLCLQTLNVFRKGEKNGEVTAELLSRLDRLKKDPHFSVRRELATILGSVAPEKALPILKNWVTSDPAVTVAAEAAEALGFFEKDPTIYDFLLETTKTKSFQDLLAAGAIAGLEALEDERALPIGVELTGPENTEQIRIAALSLVAHLGHEASGHERVLARTALMAATRSDFAVKRAAIQALGVLKDPETVSFLKDLKSKEIDGRILEVIEEALKKIRG